MQMETQGYDLTGHNVKLPAKSLSSDNTQQYQQACAGVRFGRGLTKELRED